MEIHYLPSVYWTVEVQVGSQTLELALDTRTSATILFTDVYNDDVKYYDPKHSTFYHDVELTSYGWKIPLWPYTDSSYYLQLYGNTTADVKGSWATDEFLAGSPPSGSAVAPFILARLADDVSRQFVAGGELGLGRGIDASKSAIQSILGVFGNTEISLWFGSDSSKAAITFGDKDEYHCETDPDAEEIPGDWTVRLKQVTVGPTPLLTTPFGEVVVDTRISTATPFLEVPWLTYSEVLETLRFFANVTESKAPGIILLDCADVSKLPAISVQIAKQDAYRISAADYTIQANSLVTHTPSNTCVVLIKPTGEPTWTLGLSFLPTWCINYDYSKAVLAFAKPKGTSQDVDNSTEY
ncbi:renin-like protein [Aphelenchoides avenae]|nr:renin-like protein [Aphelenchus avenae]